MPKTCFIQVFGIYKVTGISISGMVSRKGCHVMDNVMKKNIVGHGIALLGGPIAGLLMLIMVFLLPVASMRDHVYWSLDMIEKEFEDELLIDGFAATLTGNFTDCLMLELAVYEDGDHSLLDRVLHLYRAESYYDPENPEGWQPGRSLMDYLTGIPQPHEVEYGRYWHGYLVFLKPLLLFTSFNSIRLFFSAFQLLLAGTVVILMTRRQCSGLAAAFLVSLPFLYFFGTYASLSQSVCLYGMLMSVIALLILDDRMEKAKTAGIFFLLIGMLISYFDLLTYPLVTLCYPLCVYMYLHEDTVKRNLKRMVMLSLEWSLGYLWMWGSKWLLADMLSDGSVLQDALYNVAGRTGNAEGYGRIQGFLLVVSRNLEPFQNRGFLLVIVMSMAAACALVVKNGGKGRIYLAIPFACLAIYPFIWWFLAQNHSEEHWIFTCRIFAAAVFCFAAGFCKIFSTDLQTTH